MLITVCTFIMVSCSVGIKDFFYYNQQDATISSIIDQQLHLHNFHIKHSDMFRSCQIIIRELCSLLKLCYNIHNSIRFCKQGVVAACHVV